MGKIAWIVACCALGLLVVKVGVEVWLGSKIRRTIVSKVSEASDGAYWAEVGGVKVGLFNRAVRVENFTLHSDSARLRLKGSPLAGLNVRVAQLSLGGIRWDRKGASMRISADDLEIISPRIVLSRSPDAEADTSAGSRRSWCDFYRIDRIEEAFDFGYEEYFFSGNLCLVEWPEKIESLLPDDAMNVRIDVPDEDERVISID